MATIYEVCEADARHALIVLSHLVARFVSNHPDDNARALGVATAAQARCVILDLLVTTGQHLLTRSQTPRA
jgi:hypothetical protein